MFKLELSLGFSVVAALVVIIAGLIAQARYSVIFMRVLISFVVAGGLVYAATFLLERYGGSFFLGKNRGNPLQQEWISEAEIDEDAKKQTEAQEVADAIVEDADKVLSKGAVSAEDGTGGKDDDSSGANFSPLTTDGLKHVIPPQN